MTMSAPQETPGPVTILSGGKTAQVARALTADDDVWLALPDLTAVTGWELKPEGVCRDEVCIPLPQELSASIIRESDGATWINLTGFARYAGQPFASDLAGKAWSFGPPAYEWQGRAGAVMAPDFTLNDFQGRPHSLSDYRGKKVFLVTWASW
jgi:hypothetical protein